MHLGDWPLRAGHGAVVRPTLHGGPVRSRPVRATPCLSGDGLIDTVDHVMCMCVCMHARMCVKLVYFS